MGTGYVIPEFDQMGSIKDRAAEFGDYVACPHFSNCYTSSDLIQ